MNLRRQVIKQQASVHQQHMVLGTSWSSTTLPNAIATLATGKAGAIELRVPRKRDGKAVIWSLNRIPGDNNEVHFAVKPGSLDSPGETEVFTTVPELTSWAQEWRKGHKEHALTARRVDGD